MSGVSFTSSASQVLRDEGYKSGEFPFSLDPEGVAALARVSETMARQYVTSVVSAYHAFLRGGSLPGSPTSSRVEPASPVVISPWAKGVRPASPASSSGSRGDQVRAMSTWRPVVKQAKDAIEADVSLADKDGYCYLLLVKPERRSSVAMRLGRWPLLEDVMALGLEDVQVESARDLQLVRSGDVVHMQTLTQPIKGELVSDVLTLVAAQFTGTGSRAIAKGTLGRQFCLEVRPYVEGDWDARAYVGGESLEVVRASDTALRLSDTEKGQIEHAKKMLPDLVAGRRESRVGFAWITYVEQFCEDRFFHVDNSSVIFFGKDGSDAVHSIALSVPDRAIVKLPMGWKASIGGTTIGCEGATTMFGFRSKCKVRLFPPEQVVGRLEAIVLTGKRVNWALDVMLNPKSTDARFVRELGLPAILRVPSGIQRDVGNLEPNFVQITDPLQDWVAIDEVRYESSMANGSCRLSGPGLIAIKNFRSNHVSTMEVGRFATLDTSDAGVVVSSEVSVYVHKPDLVQASVRYNWSVRKLVCADEYCMDNGGPSDSEFSDAI